MSANPQSNTPNTIAMCQPTAAPGDSHACAQKDPVVEQLLHGLGSASLSKYHKTSLKSPLVKVWVWTGNSSLPGHPTDAAYFMLQTVDKSLGRLCCATSLRPKALTVVTVLACDKLSRSAHEQRANCSSCFEAKTSDKPPALTSTMPPLAPFTKRPFGIRFPKRLVLLVTHGWVKQRIYRDRNTSDLRTNKTDNAVKQGAESIEATGKNSTRAVFQPKQQCTNRQEIQSKTISITLSSATKGNPEKILQLSQTS